MNPFLAMLLKPLVDVQPVFDLVHVAQVDPEVYGEEVRALVITKLEESAKHLRMAADHVEKHLARLKEQH